MIEEEQKQKKLSSIITIILIVLGMLLLIFLVYQNNETIINFINPIDKNDKIPPEITYVTITSDNETNSNYAEEGNTITLKFKFNEQLGTNPTIIINGKETNLYKRNGYYVSYYQVLNQPTTNKQITFKIKDYKDRNNNLGKEITETTDKTTVTILAKGSKIPSSN